MSEWTWKRTYANHLEGYAVRYIYTPGDIDRADSTTVRILKWRPDDPWVVRWGNDKNKYTLPADMPVEEAMALALAYWRLDQ